MAICKIRKCYTVDRLIENLKHMSRKDENGPSFLPYTRSREKIKWSVTFLLFRMLSWPWPAITSYNLRKLDSMF